MLASCDDASRRTRVRRTTERFTRPEAARRAALCVAVVTCAPCVNESAVVVASASPNAPPLPLCDRPPAPITVAAPLVDVPYTVVVLLPVVVVAALVIVPDELRGIVAPSSSGPATAVSVVGTSAAPPPLLVTLVAAAAVAAAAAAVAAVVVVVVVVAIVAAAPVVAVAGDAAVDLTASAARRPETGDAVVAELAPPLPPSDALRALVRCLACSTRRLAVSMADGDDDGVRSVAPAALLTLLAWR
mmetsp:Transcript_16317/g.27955  ORF Transcript_16317/g.27955 Transcript_16317/m.27955 type:complete len:245 (-) Transcript_16317:511-1245(-)